MAPEKNIHIDSDYKKAKIYKPNSEGYLYVGIYEKYSTIDYKIKNELYSVLLMRLTILII